MVISYESTEEQRADETRVIYDGLRAFNLPHFGEKPKFHAIYAKEGNQIVGGAIGFCAKNEMLLDTLWVNESYRGHGIGRQLVEEIIRVAIS